MRKRLLVVGVTMLLVGAGSYQLFYSMEASPAVGEVVEVAVPGIVMKQAATPLVAARDPNGFVTFLDSLSGTTVQLTSGVMLWALGAGLRRHTC